MGYGCRLRMAGKERFGAPRIAAVLPVAGIGLMLRAG
ncbi:hypothetical protein SAMN02745830_04584 [Streptomyces sp. Amel2xC10]|nr:hypothetical protein SAMN02745830_04584 [Streptomyces sp. Amel2xC10]